MTVSVRELLQYVESKKEKEEVEALEVSGFKIESYRDYPVYRMTWTRGV